jgi:tryptophan-rich sensory protein
MGGYLLLEIATVAYVPATLRLRSLKAGTILGAIGLILGVLLTLAVWPISGQAALLLLPYVIWSAIGTNATSEMIEENPDAA